MQIVRTTTAAYIPLLGTFSHQGKLKLANREFEDPAEVIDKLHLQNQTLISQMVFLSGDEQIPGRFILMGPFVRIAKPEITKGSILKSFSLSCSKFQTINQDMKRSYFAGTAVENADNC